MHLHQNVDLVFGAAVKTVSAVKEISYVSSPSHIKFIAISSFQKQPIIFAAQFIARSRIPPTSLT